MTPKDYRDNFHDSHYQNSLDSASEIVPLFLSYFKPGTVLDVGCGLGSWLKILEQNGCEIYGIDGDYVDRSKLVIDGEKFEAHDLNFSYNLEKKFDLAISLEVAEHVFPESAKVFVDSLCSHSDIILFSAAIPGQEGTLHYNEQYNEFWVDLFSKNEFQCVDFLRHDIWNNLKISWWYRQNILIFLKNSEADNPKYSKILKEKRHFLNSYVHPELFAYKNAKAIKLERILNSPSMVIRYYLGKLKSKLK